MNDRHVLEFDIYGTDLQAAIKAARERAEAYFGDVAYNLRSDAVPGDLRMSGDVTKYCISFVATSLEDQ